MADGVSANSPVNSGRFATTAADRIRILERYKRIAMVGLSSNPFRPSHFAAIYMRSEGYDVTPVNPRKKRCWAFAPMRLCATCPALSKSWIFS